jgi:O-antigen/teichoic acid export membrane protein
MSSSEDVVQSKPKRHMGINYVLNAIGALVPVAVGLIVVPLYIHRIGADRFGIMSIVWILLGYFGFLDFGLSRASSNALSRLSGSGPSERVPVLLTALYLNIAFGAIAGIVVYAGGSLALFYTDVVSAQFKDEIVGALPWMACMLPLSMVTAVGMGAIESRERFLVSNLFSSLSSILAQVTPLLCAIFIGPELNVIVPAALLARVASTLAVLAYVIHTERPIRLSQFDRQHVRPLLGYGAWVSLTGIISPLLETVDQMIIGALLGPAAIAHYNVPMNLATRTQFVATAMAKTLFPRLSSLRSDEAHALALQSTVVLAYGFCLVCSPAIILAGPFLNLWIGAEFASYSTPVAIILLIGAWTNGIAFVPFTFLQSRGRPDLAAKIHTVEIIPFLLSVWAFTTWWGLPGAALAWTLRVTADLFLMLRGGDLIGRPLLKLIPASIIIVGSCLVAHYFKPVGLASIVVACLFGSVALGSAMIFDKGFRGIFINLIISANRQLLAKFSSRKAANP